MLRSLGTRAGGNRPKLARYYNDPVAFAHDCVRWRPDEGLAPYQEEVLDALVSHRRVALRGPHGLGKTALAAIIILWFALTRESSGDGDWKVVTTASVGRQLSHYLWPEIRKWADRLNWDVIGRPRLTGHELLQVNLKLRRGEAFAVSCSDHSAIEGAHADRIFYLFDESKAVPNEVFDAAEGALSTGDAFALAVSTPGEPVGRFYEIHARKAGLEDWWPRHVTRDEVIAAGRMSATWAEQRRRQWGERSAVYQNRVLGEFAASEADGVVPLAWVELANERWLAWQDTNAGWDVLDTIGVDVAREGEDSTVFALRAANVVVELRRYPYVADTMAVAGLVLGVQRAHGGRAIVDSIGLGAGVFDRLREERALVEGFNAAHLSLRVDKSGELGFVNRRAEAWWGLRERLDPSSGEDLALPPDDQLVGDLTAPRWKVMSRGRIQIESKVEVRKRLGRSTDAGDAVVQAFVVGGQAGWSDYYRSKVPDCPECHEPTYDARADTTQELRCPRCQAVVIAADSA